MRHASPNVGASQLCCFLRAEYLRKHVPQIVPISDIFKGLRDKLLALIFMVEQITQDNTAECMDPEYVSFPQNPY